MATFPSSDPSFRSFCVRSPVLSSIYLPPGSILIICIEQAMGLGLVGLFQPESIILSGRKVLVLCFSDPC